MRNHERNLLSCESSSEGQKPRSMSHNTTQRNAASSIKSRYLLPEPQPPDGGDGNTPGVAGLWDAHAELAGPFPGLPSAVPDRAAAPVRSAWATLRLRKVPAHRWLEAGPRGLRGPSAKHQHAEGRGHSTRQWDTVEARTLFSPRAPGARPSLLFKSSVSSTPSGSWMRRPRRRVL